MAQLELRQSEVELLTVQTQLGRLGVIVCEHSRALRPWSDDEVEIIRGVADQLAIAINQAQLYNQSRAATVAAITQAEQLNQVLHNLKQTQAQLIQTEKMSSLGQLVAGVAHEINNPVNFIYGNLTHVSEYTLTIQRDLENLSSISLSYKERDFESSPNASREGG